MFAKPLPEQDPEEDDLLRIFHEHFIVYKGWQKTPTVTILRQMKFNIASTYNQVRVGTGDIDPCNSIIPKFLFLGMQPNNLNDHPILTAPENDGWHKGLVVACLENHALNGSLSGRLLKTTSLEQYDKGRVYHHWLNMPDHSADIVPELFFDAITLMALFFKQRLPIMVHCKTGRGRSTTVVGAFLIYMLIINDPLITQILTQYDKRVPDLIENLFDNYEHNIRKLIGIMHNFIQSKRPIAEIHSFRTEKIVELFLRYQGHLKKFGAKQLNHSKHYCVLQRVGQSYAFKKLSNHLSSVISRHSKESMAVQHILYAMINNEDDWREGFTRANDAISKATAEKLALVREHIEALDATMQPLTTLK